MMPYGDRDLTWNWLRYSLIPWVMQAWEFSGFFRISQGTKKPEIITDYAEFSHFKQKYGKNCTMIISFRISLTSLLSCLVMALSHYLNLSSEVACDIHFRATSQEVLSNLILKMCSKSTPLSITTTSLKGQWILEITYWWVSARKT